VKLDQILDGGT
jgi:hypothetical protein